MTTPMPTPFSAAAGEIEDLLLNGEYQMALDRIEDLKADSLVEQRIMLHLRAQVQVYLGAFDEAKSNLHKARRHFGDNIALLRDLACLYYQTGEMMQWRQAYRELQERLDAIQSQLSPQTAIQCAVTSGKFFEEDGLLHQAMVQYQAALTWSEKARRLDLRLLSLIQLVRVQSLFHRGEGLGEIYGELISTGKQRVTFDLAIELEHSLMLAEMELIGPAHAWTRVRKALADTRLVDSDRRLMYFDFVAESLQKFGTIESQALEQGLQFAETDAFEQELLVLSRSRPGYTREMLDRLSHLASEMSWASFLRLLTIHYVLSAERPDWQLEIKNRLNLILSSLDPNSRFYWIGRIKATMFNNELALEFNQEKRLVTFQGRMADLSKRRTMMVLLDALAEKREQDVDELIERVWQSKYSPENFHRLRMTVHRLNQVLFELSSVPKVIEMTADKVSIRPNIQITSAM